MRERGGGRVELRLCHAPRLGVLLAVVAPIAPFTLRPMNE